MPAGKLWASPSASLDWDTDHSPALPFLITHTHTHTRLYFQSHCIDTTITQIHKSHCGSTNLQIHWSGCRCRKPGSCSWSIRSLWSERDLKHEDNNRMWSVWWWTCLKTTSLSLPATKDEDVEVSGMCSACCLLQFQPLLAKPEKPKCWLKEQLNPQNHFSQFKKQFRWEFSSVVDWLSPRSQHFTGHFEMIRKKQNKTVFIINRLYRALTLICFWFFFSNLQGLC